MKAFTVITIDARRWRDRINGNTYHSVAVYVDGKLVGVKPFEYGYGEQYLQTAHEVLQEAGVFPKTGEQLSSGMGKDYYDFSSYTRANRDKFVIIVNDVSARKDLHEGGRWPKTSGPKKVHEPKRPKKKRSPYRVSGRPTAHDVLMGLK